MVFIVPCNQSTLVEVDGESHRPRKGLFYWTTLLSGGVKFYGRNKSRRNNFSAGTAKPQKMKCDVFPGICGTPDSST